MDYDEKNLNGKGCNRNYICCLVFIEILVKIQDDIQIEV